MDFGCCNASTEANASGLYLTPNHITMIASNRHGRCGSLPKHEVFAHSRYTIEAQSMLDPSVYGMLEAGTQNLTVNNEREALYRELTYPIVPFVVIRTARSVVADLEKDQRVDCRGRLLLELDPSARPGVAQVHRSDRPDGESWAWFRSGCNIRSLLRCPLRSVAGVFG